MEANMTGTFTFVVLSIIIFIITIGCRNAFAYLDPASGSMILQGILAGIAAAGVAVGIFWRRLKMIIFGRKKSEVDPDDR